MSKATQHGAHFLSRTGSYSTHGRANGRVDVLPPHAQEPEWSGLKDQLKALRKQLDKAKTFEERQAIRARKRELRQECRKVAAAVTSGAQP